MTGESIPVTKNAERIEGEKLAATQQKNMVFKGTILVAGNGVAVVVKTGLNTVIGEISKKIKDIQTEIPLQKNIRYLSKLIIITVVTISISIFVIGFLTGKALEEMFLLAVAIMVSAIPEGLPVVMTLLLATGVWRMSKQNVLVKRLQAVEALGEAKIIAVDKTGTLTKSELVVQKLYLNGGEEYSVSGVGYDTKGEIFRGEEKIDPIKYNLVARAGIIAGLCSDAKIFKRDNEWKISGDPTEAALSILAVKTGFSEEILEKNFPQLAEIPFDYNLKRKASLNKFSGNYTLSGVEEENLISVTGAPEIVLKLCKKILTEKGEEVLTEEKQREILDVFTRMSESALRVIALAQKKTDKNTLDEEDINDLIFVGMSGMKDALRLEVEDAMKKTEEAGAKVVMLTGDHKITAQAIAKEAGIWKEGDEILTGDDLEKLSNEEISEKLNRVSVFARITPEHKLKIIEIYKSKGKVVAMTGDGVNDALSLVAADLGVAMGKSGTEVAKEAADLILLDDNFGSIVSAIEEGRNIYKNIKKVILYLFSTSLGEILTILIALFLGYPLPILAAQLIWLNLVTDGFLVIPLALEKKEKGLLKEKFVKPKKWFIDNWMLQRMILMSLAMSAGSLLIFMYFLKNYSYEHALSVTLTALAVFQWFKAWNCRSERKSVFQQNPFSNKLLILATAIVIVLQLGALNIPILQNILKTTPLSLTEWVLVIAVSLSTVFVDELRKLIYQKFEKRKRLTEVKAA